jgi:hypothetical protein
LIYPFCYASRYSNMSRYIAKWMKQKSQSDSLSLSPGVATCLPGPGAAASPRCAVWARALPVWCAVARVAPGGGCPPPRRGASKHRRWPPACLPHGACCSCWYACAPWTLTSCAWRPLLHRDLLPLFWSALEFDGLIPFVQEKTGAYP